jgi:uncharacterized membrane protein YgcG
MDDIRQILDSVRRRLRQGRFLRGLHYGLVGASLLVLLVVLLTKSSPVIAGSLPLVWVLAGAMTAAIVAGVIYARAVSLSPMTLALLVDERLQLKERLSTAMAVKDRPDAFARAAVADGVAIAKDKRTRESLGRSFPVRAPDNSWIGPVIALAAFGAWFLPQGDFFASSEEVQVTAQVRNEARLAETAVKNILEKNERLEKLVPKLGDPLGEQSPPDEIPKTPEEVRRDAIKNLTETQKKLDEILKGDEAQKLDAMKSQLADLNTPPGEDVAELSKALKDGDFSAAKEALEKLKAEASKDPAKKAEIERQLGDLAKQLDKLSENKAGLESALKKANLDSKLANNKEALERALENAKGLSEQQKEDIRKAMQAQQAAQKKMSELAKSCNGACNNPGQKAGDKSGSQGKDGKSGKDGEGQSGSQSAGQQGGESGMSDMLSDLESLEQMMKDAEAAMSEADKQCQGLGQCSSNMPGQCSSDKISNINGPRQGGRARANGGAGSMQKSPTATKIQKEKVELTAGDVISRQAVEGQSERGESSEQLSRLISDVSNSMDQGVTEEEVPQDRAELHKTYFGDLKNRLEAARGGAGAAPATSGTDAGKGAGSAGGSNGGSDSGAGSSGNSDKKPANAPGSDGKK